MIAFSRPARFASESKYIEQALESRATWGGGEFYQKALNSLLEIHPAVAGFLTQSCSDALELAALSIDIGPGDEIIVPSYTFVTSASAFALRGASIIYADSNPLDMNLDVRHVEQLLSPRTKAIVAVHYGGVSCDMGELVAVAKKAGVLLIEDAAQAIGATWRGKPLGTIGDLGCISFHGTKNISCGEGGALLVNSNDSHLVDRVRVAHEKGTDRAKFLKGEVDKYTWRALGGSFVPSEISASVLLSQLEHLGTVVGRRRSQWATYRSLLSSNEGNGFRVLEQGVEGSNCHMFSIIIDRAENRTEVVGRLKQRGVTAASHYEPLHLSPFATSLSRPPSLPVAEELSTRILRLPMWSEAGLDVEYVVGSLMWAMQGTSK